VGDTTTSLHQAKRAREAAVAAFDAEIDACEASVRAARRHVYLGALVLDRTAADVMLALELGVPLLDDGAGDLDEHAQASYDATFERAYQHFAEQLRVGLGPLDGGQRIAAQVGDLHDDGQTPASSSN
jgi:hypothetical protein